jgi:nitrate reductase gamma subunit
VYDPPLMMLAWLLATAAGVLVVLGVTGLRRRRIALDTYTP